MNSLKEAWQLLSRMRLVHLADVHFDAPFAGRSAFLRHRLQEAARQAFRSAVDLAFAEAVDAVVISGDLFDSRDLSFATERFLLGEARRLAARGISLIYATGNHDPGGAGGVRALEWPENVTVAAGPAPVRVDITRPDGTVVGTVTAAGHDSPEVSDDLSLAFSPPAGPGPHVAVLHTQVQTSRGAQAHDRYAPSELTHLRRAGFHYWALGHIHIPQELSHDPPVVYSGCLQGRNPGETGPKGAYVVDLTDPLAPEMSFRPLAPVRWETLEVHGLQEASSLESLARVVGDAWARARTADPGAPGVEWAVRVVLQGPSPLWGELQRPTQREELAHELEDLPGAIHVEVRARGLHPVFDPVDHRDRVDALGETLRLLEEVLQGSLPPNGGPGESDLPAFLDSVTVEDLAVSGLTGAGRTPTDPDALRAYIRRVLDGAEGEVVRRFLRATQGGGG